MTPSRPLAEIEDRDLLARARDEPAAGTFRVFYERHEREIYRFLCGLLQDPALAEDVLQETFFRVHRHLGRLDVDRPIRPWLYRVARNAALNLLRARKKVKGGLPDDSGRHPELPDANVSETAAQHERAAELRDALVEISPNVRALLIQRYGAEMKLGVLANSLGCTERTVRNRLHSACGDLLREILHRRKEGGQA